MLVACLTSLVALNGKNHAGTGNSAAFTVTQPLERAQNDAFGPPTQVGRGSDIGNNLLVEVAQGGQVAHFERAHGLAYPIQSFLHRAHAPVVHRARCH